MTTAPKFLPRIWFTLWPDNNSRECIVYASQKRKAHFDQEYLSLEEHNAKMAAVISSVSNVKNLLRFDFCQRHVEQDIHGVKKTVHSPGCARCKANKILDEVLAMGSK